MSIVPAKIIFLEQCKNCRNMYDDRENNLGLPEKICLKCNIDSMRILDCVGTRKKKCQNGKCKTCFEQSFACNAKAIYWDLRKNDDIKPRNVGIASRKKYHFKCEDCKHDLHLSLADVHRNHWCSFCVNQKRCSELSCNFCFSHSFASNPRASYWHPTKNENLKPRDVSAQNNDKYWFKCPDCSHDFEMGLSSVSIGQGCPYCVNKRRCNEEECKFCFNHSFASHEKATYWHKTKNGNIRPRDVAKGTSQKYWFTCNVCIHDINISPGKIQGGKWCGYCRKHNLCNNQNCQFCFTNSFANCKKAAWWHPTKNDNVFPRNVALNANSKYWFKCPNCSHDFEMELGSVNSGEQGCPFCVNKRRCDDKLCMFCFKHSFASHEKSIYWHPTKNGIIGPRDIHISSQTKFWFACQNCGTDFDTQPALVNLGHWCRYCRCKTERKLFEFLSSMFNDCDRQFRPDFCKNPETGRYLPFDFCIPSLKIIIELDGNQHFRDIKYWKSSAENNTRRDVYKMKKANEHHYSIIRIVQEDVWMDLYDWKTDMCKAIEACKYIQQNVYCSGDENMYKLHKTLSI